MTTIGSLAARILADASGVTRGMELTRAEAKLTRDAFMSLKTDTERLDSAIATLERARTKGVPWLQDADQYAAAVQKLRSELDPTIVAQRKQAAEAQRIQDQLRPGHREYREGIRQAKQLLDQGAISQAAYNAEKSRLRQLLPEVQARQRAVNEAEAASTAIQERLLRQAQARAHALRGVRKDLETPWDKAGATWRSADTAGLSSGEAGRLKLRGAGEYMAALPIPGLSGFGAQLASLHPAQVALNLSWGMAKTAAEAYAGTVTALSYAVYHQLQAVRELSREASRASMPVPEFIAMDLAARRAGVQTEQLSAALGKLQIKVGEAAGGNAEARAAFSGLGLSWQTLSAQDPSTQITTITGAMQALTDPSRRAAVASKLFGEEVRTLMPLLNQGSFSMQSWMAEAEKSRLLISDADAANVRAMFAAWTQVSDAVAGVTRQIGVQLAPQIAQLGADLAQLLQGDGGYFLQLYGVELLREALVGAGVAADLAIAAFHKFIAPLRVADITARGLYVALLKVREAWANVKGDKEGAADIRRQIAEQTSAIQEQTAALAKGYAVGGEGSATAYMASLNSGLRAAPPPTPPAIAPPAIDENATALAKSVEDLTKQLNEQIATAGMTAEAVTLWKLSMQGADEQVLVAVEDLQGQAAAAKAVADAHKQYDEAVGRLSERIATIGMTADETERWKLAQQGVSEEQLRVIAGMQAQAAAAQKLADASKAYDDVTKKLREQIETAGMTADELERYRLAQQGVSADSLATIASLQDQAAAAKLMADAIPPEQRFAAEQERLQRLLAKNLITQEVYAANVEKARQELLKPIVTEYRVEGVAGALAGSREAAEAIQRHRAGLIDKQAIKMATIVDATNGQIAMPGGGLPAAGATGVPPPMLYGPQDALGLATPAIAGVGSTPWVYPESGADSGGSAPTESQPARWNELLAALQSLVPLASSIAANTAEPIEVQEVDL